MCAHTWGVRNHERRARLHCATDFSDAFNWCEARRSGLGNEFLDALDRTFELVQFMPEVGPDVHRGLRRLLIFSFPYPIQYRKIDWRVDIRGCLAQVRNPRRWRRRAEVRTPIVGMRPRVRRSSIKVRAGVSSN